MKSSDRIRKALNKYQKKPVTQQGILGNEVGTIAVPNRTDYVYVRVAGLGTISVYNKRVPLILDLPVDVGYDPLEPKNFQVLNIHRYPQGGGRGLVDVATILHGKTHGWTGTDPVFIEKRQLMPLRPTPLGGMGLYVTREVTWYDGEFVAVTGQQFDLTPYVPATGSLMVLVYKDTDEIVKIQTGGVLKDIFTLSLADAPQAYPGTVPIALVRLYSGQTGIAEGYADTDLIDVRPLFSPILTGTGGGIATGTSGHIIQDEGSDLPARKYLNFKGALVWANDNSGADSTEIIISGSGVSTGTTDADAIHDNVSGEINAIAEKTIVVGSDLVIIEDSENTYAKKKVQLSTLLGTADYTGDLYLFATFLEPDLVGKLYLYVSTDGKNFQPLTAAGHFYDAPGVFRDPSIIYYADKFWIAHTSQNYNNGTPVQFTVISSDDLITWTKVIDVDMTVISNAYMVWAPEWFIDEDDSIHIFVAVSSSGSQSNHRIYEMHPEDAAMSTWSTPVEVTGTGLPAAMIDPFMIYKDGQYWLWYKNYTNPNYWIELAVSDSLTSGFTIAESGDWATFIYHYGEGECLVQVDANTWRIYYDHATNAGQAGHGIVYSDSTDDWDTWTEPVYIVSNEILQHGTVYKLTGAAKTKTLIVYSGVLPTAHASTHENGGNDEINVAGLSGLLGDPQTPTSHTHTESEITDLDHDAVKLQGRTLASTAPTNGEAVIWNAAANRWEPGGVTSVGSWVVPMIDSNGDLVVDSNGELVLTRVTI